MNRTAIEPILRELFVYEPNSGEIHWRKTGKGRRKPNGVAGGTQSKGGYQFVSFLFGERRIAIRSHRVAWFLHYGEWPERIDHINGVKSDNRIENLRAVSHATNIQNQRRARADNASGVLGVRAHGSKWRSQIRKSGKTYYLGLFATKEAAYAAYLEAKRSLHEGCTL